MATRSEIIERLALYKEAETAVLRSQSYTIGSITYRRADLAAILGEIRRLEAQLAALDSAQVGGPFQHAHAVFRGRR